MKFDGKVEALIAKMPEELGLKGFKAQSMMDNSTYNGVTVTLYKDFIISNRDVNINVIATMFMDSVMDSKLVQKALKTKDVEIERLRDEIARLEKFETHYEMQMDLNHGRNEIMMAEDSQMAID